MHSAPSSHCAPGSRTRAAGAARRLPQAGGRYRAALLVLALAPLLGGCAALVIGGAAVGAAAAYDRRGAAAFFEDQQIELLAMRALDAEPDINGRAHISVTSYNHQVLLTGQAQTEAVVSHAASLVSQLPKVQKVINEVTVGPGEGLQREGEDVVLTSRAKLALMDVNLPGFDATRVKVVTADGVVYLLGLVSTEEADAAADKVRYVPGVVRVVKLFEYREPKTSPPA